MNKIIKGKKYNTDTAKKIAHIDNERSLTDFEFWEETLYRKKNFEYFLHCYGNANSKYGVWRGNNGGAGEEIKPLSFEQAKAWAEDNLTAEEFEKEFGEVDEDKEKETIFIRTNQEIAKQFKQNALKNGMKMNEYFEKLVKSAN